MKSSRIRQALLCLTVLISLTANSQSNPPQLGKDAVPAIIKAMTLEEKVRIVVGKGFPGFGGAPASNPQKRDRLAAISGHTGEVPRLGIPSIGMADGPSGIHRFVMSKEDSAEHLFSTAWPVGTLLASSWDTALVTNVGVAFGQEIKDYGIDFILGPGANIQRNPLGGRNFEYYSEDPLVSGETAAAMINGIQSQGVGATIKHFAANNEETDRNSLNEIISERALREIYLKNFEIAIKNSHPWAVMSSYNLINGTYTSESYDLLTTILKKEWGFKGFVMTDWFGGKDAVAQMKAGNNLLMPGTTAQIKTVMDAVKSGQLPESVIDENLAAILRVFQNTPSVKGLQPSNHPDLEKHALLSREAAAQSMVLLKNSGMVLPLRNASKNIALFGNHAYDLIAGGTGSGDVNKAYAVSLAEGLPNAGYTVDKQVQTAYRDYLNDFAAKHPKKSAIAEIMSPSPYAPEFAMSGSMVNQSAASADAGIIYIGRNAGEGKDRQVQDDYELTDTEKQLFSDVIRSFHAQHKPVIAVLNIAGVIDVMPFKDSVDAILLAWQPGQEGGNAIADVLSGKVDPSGKLATTFPVKYADVPSAKSFTVKEFPDKAISGTFGQKNVPAEVTYEEGIYVGYRYYNTFNVKPAYEFGFGLSYTNFSFNDVKLNATDFKNEITATFTIINSGKVAGKEVAELYLSAPSGKLDKPSEELKCFAKTALLQPGQSQSITFTIHADDLASFDTPSSSWIAAAGNYTVKIGASSLDIKSTAIFNLAKDMTVEKVHNVLMPQVSINEIKK